MIYNIIPIKSTTIYSKYQTMNTGVDQILTLKSQYNNSTQNHLSRLLIQYNLQQFFIKTGIPTSSLEKVVLKLYSTSQQYLSYNTSIQCLPIYKQWQSGYGYYQITYPSTDGAS